MKVNTLLLDLSAAFDLVAHDQLLRKLVGYGFSVSSLKLIESYLKGRKVFSEVETCQSSVIDMVNCGVPQGSILGPLLFLIHMNDIYLVKANNNISQLLNSNDRETINRCRNGSDPYIKS